MLEESTTISTAQDLYEFLKDIPQHYREMLPIEVVDDAEDPTNAMNMVEAVDIIEDGARVTMLRISLYDE